MSKGTKRGLDRNCIYSKSFFVYLHGRIAFVVKEPVEILAISWRMNVKSPGQQLLAFDGLKKRMVGQK